MVKTCFNPFIQVFYFYWILCDSINTINVNIVLIPLFRSFIFTCKEIL